MHHHTNIIGRILLDKNFFGRLVDFLVAGGAKLNHLWGKDLKNQKKSIKSTSSLVTQTVPIAAKLFGPLQPLIFATSQSVAIARIDPLCMGLLLWHQCINIKTRRKGERAIHRLAACPYVLRSALSALACPSSPTNTTGDDVESPITITITMAAKISTTTVR